MDAADDKMVSDHSSCCEVSSPTENQGLIYTTFEVATLERGRSLTGTCSDFTSPSPSHFIVTVIAPPLAAPLLPPPLALALLSIPLSADADFVGFDDASRFFGF